jgi:hypothetical protein
MRERVPAARGSATRRTPAHTISQPPSALPRGGSYAPPSETRRQPKAGIPVASLRAKPHALARPAPRQMYLCFIRRGQSAGRYPQPSLPQACRPQPAVCRRPRPTVRQVRMRMRRNLDESAHELACDEDAEHVRRKLGGRRHKLRPNNRTRTAPDTSHPHRDWTQPLHVCAGTRPTPYHIRTGLGPGSCHICAGTGSSTAVPSTAMPLGTHIAAHAF